MSHGPTGQTRDLIENRERLGIWKKAKLLAISLREMEPLDRTFSSILLLKRISGNSLCTSAGPKS